MSYVLCVQLVSLREEKASLQARTKALSETLERARRASDATAEEEELRQENSRLHAQVGELLASTAQHTDKQATLQQSLTELEHTLAKSTSALQQHQLQCSTYESENAELAGELVREKELVAETRLELTTLQQAQAASQQMALEQQHSLQIQLEQAHEQVSFRLSAWGTVLLMPDFVVLIVEMVSSCFLSLSLFGVPSSDMCVSLFICVCFFVVALLPFCSSSYALSLSLSDSLSLTLSLSLDFRSLFCSCVGIGQ
jgi:cobalamin biosynthesis Mg chelatase CobN